MALKDTYKHLKSLLEEIVSDLEKAENGNKAASQRVRTGTIKLEKVAKLYRKESIKSEKTGSTSKASAKKGATASKAKAAPAKAPAKASASSKASASKAPSKADSSKKSTAAAASKGKKTTTKTSVKPKSMAVKRPTAKLPRKKK